ncbi:hypothetical protein SDC9_161837 [bioreactor metagenome]|uniref:Uncharacterized protein n=1 Tax=bioreactor metagenome TaxID=1076179 RepID=A0A645FKM2_9ZZZZ
MRDVLHLVGREMGADHGRVEARLAPRQHQLGDLHTVFQQHGEGVLRVQAARRQPLRHAQGIGRHLPGTELLTCFGLDQGHPLWPGPGPAEEVVHLASPLHPSVARRSRRCNRYQQSHIRADRLEFLDLDTSIAASNANAARVIPSSKYFL